MLQEPLDGVAECGVSEPMQVVVLASGVYPRALPPELARALEEEVKLHMQAYGLKQVNVVCKKAE